MLMIKGRSRDVRQRTAYSYAAAEEILKGRMLSVDSVLFNHRYGGDGDTESVLLRDALTDTINKIGEKTFRSF